MRGKPWPYADGSEFLGFHADALVVFAEVLRLSEQAPRRPRLALEEAVAPLRAQGQRRLRCESPGPARRGSVNLANGG